MKRIRCLLSVLLLSCTLLSSEVAPAESEPVANPPEAELFILIGHTMVWIGNTIGYTVYETARVEARIHGISGETVLIFRLGEQEPGRYLLPWDGTYHGEVALGGRYTFELFFDDEYAVEFVLLARVRS